MAIGQSKLHQLAARRRLLSESLVWFNAFDVNLKTFMLDLIREDQLSQKGVDADNDVIGYYSLTTSFINPIKKFNTHYTLEDKGDFFRSMFIQVLSDRVFADASSNSFREMQDQEWYNNRILDWTNESIEKVKERLLPYYIDTVRKALLGNR